MGIIGKYLDSLTDEQRDRVIQHPDPTYDGSMFRETRRNHPQYGCACLVGAAEDVPPTPLGLREWHDWIGTLTDDAMLVGRRFPDLTDRRGAPEAWRLVKARAAKGHALPIAAIREPEPVAG